MAKPTSPTPRGSSSPNSPGFFGALKDAIGALAKSTSVGRQLSTRDKKIDAAVDETDVSRLRRQQHSDHYN